MCGCVAQDTTGKIPIGVLPCGHTIWADPPRRPIWLGEQECFSWGVTAWAAVAAAALVGWPVRVLTRNRVPRAS